MDPCQPNQPMRQGAQSVLEQEKKRNEARAKALEILIRVIPWSVLSEEDEKLLWEYFIYLPR